MKKALLAIALIAFVAAVPVAAIEDGAEDAQSASQLAAQKAAQAKAEAAAKAGMALLDKLTATFKHLAESGTGNRQVLEHSMQELVVGLRQAKARNEIDQVFYYKFNRILVVIHLAIIEDPGGMLSSIISREVGDFIEEVTGARIALSSGEGKGVGIGVVAHALANEILNLRMYLETLPRREAMMQDFHGQFAPGKKEE